MVLPSWIAPSAIICSASARGHFDYLDVLARAGGAALMTDDSAKGCDRECRH
jgi:hypothetical protein